MKNTAIRISETYKVPESYRAELGKAGHLFGHSQPAPDELGGYFDFTDWRGKAVSAANFIGRWTLLYFGYSRCQGSCKSAVPLITEAARTLRLRGFAAKAAFVDIEAPALGMIVPIKKGLGHETHGSNWPKRHAMSHLAIGQGEDLDLLTGSRFQLAQATAAFHVLREHVPPRAHEEGISINHSSMVYLIGPDTFVAGYGYHDAGAKPLVDLVERLSQAERTEVDLAAVRARFVRGACGVA
jgi:protein SCO1/2